MSHSGGMPVATGGCLCGAVRFETLAPASPVVACHCSMCRRQSGHFWASADVPKDALRLTDGLSLKWYESSPGVRRGFCAACGSFLFFDVVAEPNISISAGAFDGRTGLRTEAHIYVADKGDYYDLADGVPQFPQDRPAGA